MDEVGETRHEPQLCDAALGRAFQFLGKRWNGVLLATLVGGPLGFAQLKRAVAGISDSVLSERLTELAGAGLVQRFVQAGPPVTVTYELTANGRALTPALQELTTWASENLTAEQCDGAASPATARTPAHTAAHTAASTTARTKAQAKARTKPRPSGRSA